MSDETAPVLDPQEKKEKIKKRVILGLLIGLLSVAILGLLFSTVLSDLWYDLTAETGSYDGRSEQEILDDLNRQVAEGMMNISIAATITFEDGSAEGEARIQNIEGNKRDQKVVITLDEGDEVIYESGAIPPGSHIQTIKLNRDLDAGSYDATATFVGYDLETHQETGKAAAQIKIVVLK